MAFATPVVRASAAMSDVSFSGLFWVMCIFATLALGGAGLLLQGFAVVFLRMTRALAPPTPPALDVAFAVAGPMLCVVLGAVAFVVNDVWVRHLPGPLHRQFDTYGLLLPLVSLLLGMGVSVALFAVGRRAARRRG